MNDPPATMFLAGRIPLPTAQPTAAPFSQAPPHGILKKPTVTEPPAEKRPDVKKKEPAGCPSGPPPDLHDMRELDSDYEDEEPPKAKKTKTIRFADETKAAPDIVGKSDEKKDDAKLVEADVPKPTSLQQRMLAISGQNIDEFMKEMENVHKKKEQERAADLLERLSTLEKDKKDESEPSDCMCTLLSVRGELRVVFHLAIFLFPFQPKVSRPKKRMRTTMMERTTMKRKKRKRNRQSRSQRYHRRPLNCQVDHLRHRLVCHRPWCFDRHPFDRICHSLACVCHRVRFLLNKVYARGQR